MITKHFSNRENSPTKIRMHGILFSNMKFPISLDTENPTVALTLKTEAVTYGPCVNCTIALSREFLSFFSALYPTVLDL
jgi:hypothetical protein